MTFSSKLPNVNTTIFTVMSKMAAEHNAINMAQGFPDYSCDDELVDLVYTYMKAGLNQYAPMAGVALLREAIAEKIKLCYNAQVNPETEITLTCGASEAVYTAISTVVKPGDEVIVFEPAFDSYVPAIQLCGGKPVFIEMNWPHYKPDWDLVRKAINKRTKLIIINSPHNPTGSTLAPHDLLQLEEIVTESGLFVLSDEVYEHITFDNLTHESILKHPGLRDRSFTAFSFGKTYHTTGWRMGYCVAPAHLTEEFRKIHQYITFSIPTPMQFAMADFLKKKEHYLKLPDFYQKKRDFFNTALKESRFLIEPSEGTYFQLANYSHISKDSDVVMAEKLTKENGIACIPVSTFYHNKKDDKILRFCFAKQEGTLRKATDILCKI
ncbi:methionine aminotransferase [Cytophagaceae bacterium ABcell3]|nr:methionine aminotransferase [Cytophagaceae bacterium ABcell3]